MGLEDEGEQEYLVVMLKLLIDTRILALHTLLGSWLRGPCGWSWTCLLVVSLLNPSSSLHADPARAPSGSGRAHDSTAARFTSQRSNSDQRIPEGGQADLAVLKALVVSDMWLLRAENKTGDPCGWGEHTGSGALSFWCDGLDPYPIDCAAYRLSQPGADPRIEARRDTTSSSHSFCRGCRIS